MFETTGIVDEQLLKEIRKYMITPKQRTMLLIFIFVTGGLSFVCLVEKNYFFSIIFLIGLTVFLLESVILKNIAIKRVLERMKENNRVPEIRVTTSFNKEGIQIQNLTNNARVNINYEFFVKFVETKSAFFLFTKSWQIIVVFKEESIQKEKLCNFLKEQPTKIKW